MIRTRILAATVAVLASSSALAGRPPETSCKVGRSVYKLPYGMTLDDVVKKIGCDGVLVITQKSGGHVYQWTGKTYAAYIRLVFDKDDRLKSLGGFLPPLPGDEE